MSPADEWQLAQGTVEFRDEERRHRSRTDQVSSGLSAPDGGTGTSQHRPLTGAEPYGVSAGQTAAGASTPVASPKLCPNCIVELDDSFFCSLCGRTETSA